MWTDESDNYVLGTYIKWLNDKLKKETKYRAQ